MIGSFVMTILLVGWSTIGIFVIIKIIKRFRRKGNSGE
jgi:hypothetical protein